MYFALRGPMATRDSGVLMHCSRAVWLGLVFAVQSLGVATVAAAQPLPHAEGPPRLHGALSLEQATRTGLRYSPLLSVKDAELNGARATARMARAALRPQVTAVSLWTASSMASIVTPPSDMGPMTAREVPAKPFGGLSLMAMSPLYTGGRLEAEFQSARHLEQSVAAASEANRLDVVLEIQSAYYAAAYVQALEKVAQARVKTTATMLSNAESALEAGRAIQATVQRVRAEKAEAERALVSARGEIKRSLIDLYVAMGVDLSSDVSLDPHVLDTESDLPAPPSPSRALPALPEVAAAQAAAEAARRMSESARGRSRPQIHAVLMSEAFTPAAMRQNGAITAGIVASLPILDGGQRAAFRQASEAEAARAEAQSRQIALDASRNLKRAAVDLETASAQVSAAKAAVHAAQQAYEVISVRVEAQRGILIEQLDAYEALARAQANEAEALYSRAVAAARLRRAMGRM